MPDQNKLIDEISNQPNPLFKKGDIVEVNVFRDIFSALNGIIPKVILQVFGPGATIGTWALCEKNTNNVTIPSCPENLMKKI
jgi:hypothetical protein